MDHIWTPRKKGIDVIEYAWPIALVVLSNTIYQICAKSLPADVHPLASLTVTYLVAAVASGVMYRLISRGGSLIGEYAHLNWTSFALGIAIIGLECGMLYTYRVGWPVSTASIVQASFLAISLLVVGAVLFHEPITANKVIGLAICLVGLYIINR